MAEITIDLPSGRQPITLEVTTGPLPNGAELVLESTEGVVLGSVSVFGVLQQDGPMRHQIAVLPEGVLTGRVTVTGRVIVDGASRAARDEELLGVRLLD